MFHPGELIARLLTSIQYLHDNVVPAEYWPDATLTAGTAIALGAILALWGAKLLRVVYVLAFMGLGGTVGVRIAQGLGTDILIGLLLGAGAAGLAGYLLYRWWVGVTAATAAVLLIGSIMVARGMPDIEAEIRAFHDQRSGVGTGQYVLPPPQDSETQLETAQAYFKDLGTYLWDHRGSGMSRALLILGIAAATGLGMGLTLPRFTTVLGTSIVGVAGLAFGVSVLALHQWPEARSVLVDQSVWLLAGVGLVLMASLGFQAHGGKKPSAPGSPAAQPA